MIKEYNQLRHKEDLAFFGKITAGVTHELNNVLSIINEYSGLLDDMVIAAQKGHPLEETKVQRVTQNIGDQIKRQQEIIKLLNRFAHRIDKPLIEFNLNQLVSDIIRLSQCCTALKRIKLEITTSDDNIMLTNNPFEVQHVLFSYLNLALQNSAVSDCINISLEINDSKAIIGIESPGILKTEETEKMIDFASNLLNSVGGEIENTHKDNDRQIQQIFIPFSNTNGDNNHQEDL